MSERRYKHNDLFRPDPSRSHLNACVGFNGGPADFRTYADAYLRAGITLIKSCERHEQPVDLMIYPIAYNLRHGIELYLKHFCRTLPRLWESEEHAKPSHRLLDNWAIVKKYVSRDSYFSLGFDAVDLVERIIKDVVEIDPSGEIFRFPYSRKHDLHLTEQSLINVLVLESAIGELLDVFVRWDHIYDDRMEYINEYRQSQD